jgi:ABC-type uncharacterized transport system YnjBCD permease subunit
LSELKESTTQKPKHGKYSLRLFLLEVAIGIGVMAVWSPLAAALGIVFPWMNIIFVVAWVIFWMTPVGQRIEGHLIRLINGG